MELFRQCCIFAFHFITITSFPYYRICNRSNMKQVTVNSLLRLKMKQMTLKSGLKVKCNFLQDRKAISRSLSISTQHANENYFPHSLKVYVISGIKLELCMKNISWIRKYFSCRKFAYYITVHIIYHVQYNMIFSRTNRDKTIMVCVKITLCSINYYIRVCYSFLCC